ncbi:hypothetical protein [Fibrobacter sp.]|uniref:hypothetical protein n=1 Tax=Fibrobacter sp. TaxID=35828 RepID=UPI00389058F0
MANEKMKVGLSFNGKSVEVELTQEQLKELGLIEEKKKTGYERVERYDTYYAPTIVSNRTGYTDMHCGYDDLQYNRADYYSDATISQNNARADCLMRRLRRFAAENGGIPSVEDWEKRNDFNEAGHRKYVIEYDHFYKKLEVGHWLCRQEPGLVYFKSYEACEKAIEEFKSDLIWYFTEYQAMLY